MSRQTFCCNGKCSFQYKHWVGVISPTKIELLQVSWWDDTLIQNDSFKTSIATVPCWNQACTIHLGENVILSSLPIYLPKGFSFWQRIWSLCLQNCGPRRGRPPAAVSFWLLPVAESDWRFITRLLCVCVCDSHVGVFNCVKHILKRYFWNKLTFFVICFNRNRYYPLFCSNDLKQFFGK